MQTGDGHRFHVKQLAVCGEVTDLCLGPPPFHGEPNTRRLNHVARRLDKLAQRTEGSTRHDAKRAFVRRESLQSLMPGMQVGQAQITADLPQKGDLLSDGIDGCHGPVRLQNRDDDCWQAGASPGIEDGQRAVAGMAPQRSNNRKTVHDMLLQEFFSILCSCQVVHRVPALQQRHVSQDATPPFPVSSEVEVRKGRRQERLEIPGLARQAECHAG